MMNEEIKLIENVIEEAVTMKEYGKRDGCTQFEILTIDGEPMEKEALLLVHLDKELRLKNPKSAIAIPYVNSNAFGIDNFYGELYVFYYKKKKGLFGKETLKAMNTFSKKYHKDAVENGTEAKVKLKEVMSEK